MEAVLAEINAGKRLRKERPTLNVNAQRQLKKLASCSASIAMANLIMARR
jgi:hypothetical protein